MGDLNGSGGANLDWDSSSDGSGEVMVLGEEDRVEALPWGARIVKHSENSALPLLPLLPPMLRFSRAPSGLLCGGGGGGE